MEKSRWCLVLYHHSPLKTSILPRLINLVLYLTEQNSEYTIKHILACAQSCSFVTSWTAANQGPVSMEFFRKEYWNRLPFLPPQDLPDAGIKPMYPAPSCISRQVLYH